MSVNGLVLLIQMQILEFEDLIVNLMSKSKSLSKQFTTLTKVSIMGFVIDMSAFALHHYADKYLEAAKKLAPIPSEIDPARSYLICHSIELSLKAYLCMKGIKMPEAIKYMHKLEKILDKCIKLDLSTLVTLSNSEIEEIEKASIYYSGKVFEYPSIVEGITGYGAKPNMQILLEIADRLVQELRLPSLEHSQ